VNINTVESYFSLLKRGVMEDAPQRAPERAWARFRAWGLLTPTSPGPQNAWASLFRTLDGHKTRGDC
jgi:hypothetical protein